MKRQAWLEDVSVLGLAAALVSVWLSLWLGWILRLALPGPSAWPLLPWLVGGLVMTGAQVTRSALSRPRLHLRRTRLFVGASGAILVAAATVLTFPLQFGVQRWYLLPNLGQVAVAALPVCLGHAYAWWSGIRLGRAAVGHHTVAGAFYTGVLCLALLFMLNTFTPAFTAGEAVLPVLLFFTLGLSGLALTSLRRLRAQQRTVTLSRLALTRHWLATALTVIALVIFVGLLVARVIAPEALSQLADLLDLTIFVALLGLAALITPALYFLVSLLAPVLLRLADALLALLTAFERLGQLVWGLLAGLQRLVGRRLPRLFTAEQLEQFIHSPWVQVGGRWGVVVLFFVLALVIFWLAVRRLSRLAPLDEDELRDSIFSLPLLWSQLRGLYRRRPRPAAPSRYLSLSGSPDDARFVARRAYQAMLEWAQSVSLPRAAGQTPRAYAEVLAGAMPQAREAIGALTTAYLLARYADEAPSLEQARSAAGAAARLWHLPSKAATHA